MNMTIKTECITHEEHAERFPDETGNIRSYQHIGIIDEPDPSDPMLAVMAMGALPSLEVFGIEIDPDSVKLYLVKDGQKSKCTLSYVSKPKLEVI